MDREGVRVAAAGLLRDAGLTSLPIDVHAAAAHCGLQIRLIPDMPDPVSGLLYRGSLSPVIAVNARHSPARRRFTIAHEIWHWKSDAGAVSLHVAAEGENHSWAEEAADAFAAELLMPEELLRQEYARNPDRDALCWRFGVSSRALARRLQELGLITSGCELGRR
jgi:Zn-dependent peptidase ImmA (M78 family)